MACVIRRPLIIVVCRVGVPNLVYIHPLIRVYNVYTANKIKAVPNIRAAITTRHILSCNFQTN